jgi:tripartite-type tricarboxylate transporter receptor subunit TctC
MRRRTLAAAAAALLAAAKPAAAQAAYPSRPVRLLVGFPPGGSTDIFARTIGEPLAAALGQPVVVENRGGAGGNIASDLVAKAAPDGHTLLMAISAHVTNRTLYPNLPYDPVRDFTPISLVCRVPFAVLVHPSFPARSVADLLRLARQRPGEIAYATAGTGSTQHLAGELLNRMAGVQLNHVGYRGGASALTDLVAGTVPVALLTTTQVLPQLREGRVRALAVTSPGRSPMFPDLPTLAESGVPGYEADVWYGVLAPAGVPAPIVGRLHAEIARILALPATRDRFAAQDAVILNGSPQDLAALMAAEDAKWPRIIREAGIRPD